MFRPGNDRVGRKKYYYKGQKLYAPLVRIGRRIRILHLSAKTAEGAMSYGQRVADRYQHWCDIALAKETKKHSA